MSKKSSLVTKLEFTVINNMGCAKSHFYCSTKTKLIGNYIF